MKEGSNINCVGCTNLDNVEINGVVESITIDAWSNNISIPVSGSLDCKSITIENRRFDHLTINITNAKTLETLIISNCENLNIGNCPKLKEIIFSDGGEGNPYYKVVKSLHLDIPPYSSARNYDVLKINSEYPGVLDLRQFENLEELSVTNSLIKLIILPEGNQIRVPNLGSIGGFENNEELTHILGNDVSLLLMGARSFYNCKRFTMRKGEYSIIDSEHYTVNETEILPIYVDSSCESLANTFKIDWRLDDNIMTIGYNEACDFLTRNADNVENVKDISSMFENQTISYNRNKGLQEYLNGDCTISLANFVNCENFNRVYFNNRNIEFYNKYMFVKGDRELAKNKETIEFVNIINGNGIVYTTEDFLYDIIEKITVFSMNSYLQLVTEDGLNSPDTYLYKIFNFQNSDSSLVKYPIRLTRISGLNIANGGSMNIEIKGAASLPEEDRRLINDHWLAAKENGIELINFLGAPIANYVMGENNLKYLISSNIKINRLEASLNGLRYDSDNVDLYTLFDWENNFDTSLTTLFVSSDDVNNSYNYQSLQFEKTITYSKFRDLLSKIFNTYHSLTSLNYLFNYCSIIVDDNANRLGDHFYLVNDEDLQNQYENIMDISNLFCNLKIKNQNGDELPIPFTWRTLYCLPKLVKITNAFSSIQFRYPLSFDFFHKREEIVENVYSDANQQFPITLTHYNYRKELDKGNGAFYNCSIVNENTNVDNKIVKYVKPFEEDTIYNKDFENNSVVKRNQLSITGQDYYYDDAGIRYELIQPSEISDFEEASQEGYSTYHYLFMPDFNRNISNSQGYAYDNVTKKTGVFVAPDILYGFASTSTFKNFFYNDNTTKCSFSGTLPRHLLYREDLGKLDASIDHRTKDLSGVLYNLNILPIYLNKFRIEENISGVDYNEIPYSVGLHKFYYFVPKDFIDGNTHISANTFSFKMLMPCSDKASKTFEHFFVFMNNSLPTYLRSIENNMPLFTGTQMNITNQDQTTTPIYDWNSLKWEDSSREPIYFNIMGNVELDEHDDFVYGSTKFEDFEITLENVRSSGQTNSEAINKMISLISEGIDLNRFELLALDNIFNDSILCVIYGKLFVQEIWDKNRIKEDKFLMSCYTNLSAFAKILLPLTNNRYMQVYNTDYQVSRTNILNTDNLNEENVRNYYLKDVYYARLSIIKDLKSQYNIITN